MSSSRDKDFMALGLTDIAQALMPRLAKPLVVTVDAGLFACLEARRLPVINLNHYAFAIRA